GDVYVTAPGHRTIAAHVEVPAGGVARLDLSLADSAADHGPAVIRGRVLRPNGKPVAFGRALLAALGREVPLQDGNFVLSDLPLGSWEVEARVIGAEPQTMLVHATESGVVATTITVNDAAQRLSAVTVMGRRDRNVRTLNEILARQRSSFGTSFMPGSADLKAATRVTDVMRYARGFKYRSSQQIFGRDLPNGPCRNVAVYVNGTIFAEGIASLDAAVPIEQVLAMETYPDVLYAPIQWRSNMGLDPSSDGNGRMTRALGPRSGSVCAVIVVWTKH
ncbi:MAG: carboxypeptidase-like regulatory domain-containing protein, partial [Gemmatimonadaceae bacterium]